MSEVSESEQVIRDKIYDALTVYPVQSPSMLQTKIGAALPGSLWKPILEKMVNEGIVARINETHTLSSGQERNFTKLSLVERVHKSKKNGLRALNN